MRFPFVVAALLALVISRSDVSAQNASVSVELELDQEQFLPSEDIKVAVRIINLSGRTLRMGDHNGWVKFFVESKDGFPVAPDTDPVVIGEFELPTSKTGIKRVNLIPHFPVKQSGRYTVRAEVEVPGWNKTVSSRPVAFDILNGTVMKTITVGVPQKSTATNGVPEQRNFLLQRANYLKKLQLYVRVTDLSGGNTLRVLRVGQLTSIGEPEAQVDRHSNLHVLFRTGAQTFRYVVVNADGDLIRREMHEFGKGAPKLRVNDENEVVVIGGVRREMSSDIPAAALAEQNAGEKAQ